MWRLLADATVVVHHAFLLYLAELAVQLLVAAVVVSSWIGLLVRRRRSVTRRALTSTPLW